MACEKAEMILKYLGDSTYKTEASNFAKLLMDSPYLTKPDDFSKCYLRVYATLPEEDQAAFVKDKFMGL